MASGVATAPRLALLYRGPLDSCNYACAYCPFALRAPARAMLEDDRAALEQFVTWALSDAAQRWSLEILFTPYGEGLIWPWYRDAMIQLSSAQHVRQVSIQTNASGPMEFLSRCSLSRISLWISWHPSEIDGATFAQKIATLHTRGIRLSVGAVAVPGHIERVEDLRRRLPSEVSMWINAQKPNVRYMPEEVTRWRALDANFDFDRRRHLTRGRACMTGEDTVSVDGAGDIRRCHFVDDVLGNLYCDDLISILHPRVCTRHHCDCWIGYSNLTELDLRKSFHADALLARIWR